MLPYFRLPAVISSTVTGHMSDKLCLHRPTYKRIRRPGRVVHNQPLYRADVRNESSYTATPHPPVSLLWQLWGDDIYP
jgi:hypothetical protein